LGAPTPFAIFGLLGSLDLGFQAGCFRRDFGGIFDFDFVYGCVAYPLEVGLFRRREFP
jgi:hypothetical protein